MAYLALLPKNTTFFGDDLDAESDDECNDDGLLEPELDKSANRNTSISNGIKFRIQVYLSDILIQYTISEKAVAETFAVCQNSQDFCDKNHISIPRFSR